MIKRTPESFINISLIEEKFFNPFKNEAKIPAKTITTPCPKEKTRSIKEAVKMFLLKVAKLIIPANIGVEQGLDAKANKTPIKKG